MAYGTTVGAYMIQVRSGRPAYEARPPNERQIIFLDFDGATINPNALFGRGNTTATLTGLADFLTNWGLTQDDEDDVIDAILAVVQENFDELRSQDLNGDRRSDGVPGHFDVEFRNSRDDGNPFGQPNIARVIIGGTIAQIGITTIGVAQFIDPGNFARNDTAVVLLDSLSGPADNPNSINGIPLDPSITIIDAIGLRVGNTVSHEAGHYLGNWHTENSNATACVMDRGGRTAAVGAGAGPDGILGTADDVDRDFVQDAYSSAELWGGQERTHFRTAFGLATGATGIYVDRRNISGIEDGTWEFPYNTVIEGYDNSSLGETVLIQGGIYPEAPLTFDTWTIFASEGGTTVITGP